MANLKFLKKLYLEKLIKLPQEKHKNICCVKWSNQTNDSALEIV